MEDQEAYETQTDEEYVASVWERDIVPLVADTELATEYFERIVSDYSQDTRRHHSLGHIADFVHKLQVYQGREDYTQLLVAALLHDWAYDVERQDNEEVSAWGAAVMMEELGLPGADAVSRMMVSTKEHDTDKEDEQLICAIDLSILAESPQVYAAYADGVRYEYMRIYTAEQYNFGRKGALAIMAKKPGPIQHPDFVHLNERAIANMEAEAMLLPSE